MSHKKNQIWVMMPVLGLLLMSPKDIQSKYGRHIASDKVSDSSQEVSPKVDKSKTPKLDALMEKVEIPKKQNPLNLNSDMLKEDISKLLTRVSKAEEFEKDSVQKPQLEKLREEIKVSAIELRQVEESLKDLLKPEDVGDVPSRISEAKIHLEASLKDLETAEAIVAARPLDKPAPEAKAPEAKVVKRSPGIVEEETSVASDSKEEKDPILCALEEQNKLLKEQLQGFVQQQSLIMQQLMQMAQMSQMMFMQSMYRQPETFNYNKMYQYHQAPTVAGNWVYYPHGQNPLAPLQAQPVEQNIFGLQSPGILPQSVAPQTGLQRPDFLNQGQGQWGLSSQTPFNIPYGNSFSALPGLSPVPGQFI